MKHREILKELTQDDCDLPVECFVSKKELLALCTKLETYLQALNYIGMLQMGSLDYTQDFFELTKRKIRETLDEIDGDTK